MPRFPTKSSGVCLKVHFNQIPPKPTISATSRYLLKRGAVSAETSARRARRQGLPGISPGAPRYCLGVSTRMRALPVSDTKILPLPSKVTMPRLR